MRFSMGVALGLIALATDTAASAAVQQDTVTADTVPLYKLEGITVKVARSRDLINRLPYAVGLLRAPEIWLVKPAISLEESLLEIPGVFVNNRYNFAVGDRISIRGFGSRSQFGVRGIRIIQDGIPLTLPDGQSQLNNLDLAAAGRIEVIRGPSSSLYGNASGGVISIQTEPAADVRFRPEIRILAGGYGNDQFYQKYDLKGNGRSGRFEYFAHITHFNNDGYRVHSESEYTLFNTRVRYQLDERSDLTAVINYVNSPVSQNPSTLDDSTAAVKPDTARDLALPAAECPPDPGFGGCQDLGEASKQGQAGLTYRRLFSGNHEIAVSGYGLFRELSNPIPLTLIELDRWVAGARAEYRWFAGGRLTQLVAGFDLDHQNDDRVESCRTDQRDPLQVQCREDGEIKIELDQKEKVTGIGIFADTRWALIPNLELTASARYDAVRFEVDDRLIPPKDPDDSGSRTLDQLSPLVALRYTHASWLNVYGNVGRSFQTPSTTEFTDTIGGFNFDLEPERATTYEAGLKGTAADRVSYSLALFRSNIDNQLIGFESENDRVLFENAGSSRQQGLEAGISTLLTEGLTLIGAYTYSDFEFKDFVTGDQPEDDFSGNKVPGIPRHQLRGRLKYRHPTLFLGEAELTWVDDFFADNANENKNEGYTVLNLRFAYDAHVGSTRIAPFIGINNVTDERYNSSVVINAFRGRFFEPAPGRNAYVGLRVQTR